VVISALRYKIGILIELCHSPTDFSTLQPLLHQMYHFNHCIHHTFNKMITIDLLKTSQALCSCVQSVLCTKILPIMMALCSILLPSYMLKIMLAQLAQA